MTTATKKLSQQERLAALEAKINGMKKEYGIVSKPAVQDDYDSEPSFWATEWTVGFWAVVLGVVVKVINEAING
jgi:hypothetical protein